MKSDSESGHSLKRVKWTPSGRSVTARWRNQVQVGKLTYLGLLRFETAGESHGECLVATLTGLPAGIPISIESINLELWRRQQGFGRGGRMKIETDRAEVVSGVRHSQTIGSPIAVIVRNSDWKNWTDKLPVEGGDPELRKPVTRPRP